MASSCNHKVVLHNGMVRSSFTQNSGVGSSNEWASTIKGNRKANFFCSWKIAAPVRMNLEVLFLPHERFHNPHGVGNFIENGCRIEVYGGATP